MKLWDVVVIGDEVESIITAVSAARCGIKVALVRRSTGLLGGLSTRGGLSYMDITPEYTSPLFQEFLDKAGVVRVALDSGKAHQVLAELVKESGIELFSGVSVTVLPGSPHVMTLSDGEVLQAKMLIDATPDADIARQLAVPFLQGLGEILGEEQNYLGFSPVFRIAGASVDEMQAFEARLRGRPDIRQVLEEALPWHPSALREEYVTRLTYSPDDMDYLDILNPVIGIYYHCWRHGEAGTYPMADIAIDGANISLLPDGSMGFNGMVASSRLLGEAAFDRLLAFSHGAPVPSYLLEEMQAFERFLQEEGMMKNAQVIPPQELYVRQTLTLLAKDNMTAEKAIRGGVPVEKAIGTFSYWLDLRGAQLWKQFPGEHLPKPIFNVGLDVALPCVPKLENFAFIGRSAGYSPIGQGAGRIVQHNAMLGEGIGIAVALAVLGNTTLGEMAEHGVSQVQEVLAYRGARPSGGQPTWTEAQIQASQLLKRDREIIEGMRERLAVESGIF